MKLRPVTKLDKKNKKTSKKLTMPSCRQVMMSLSFFRFFRLLQKLQTKLKSLNHSLHTTALSKGNIFAKNTDFLPKHANISKIKSALVLKGIFSEIT